MPASPLQPADLQPADLKPLLLVQLHGTQTLLKISTVSERSCTAQVLLEDDATPPRTSVRTFTAEQASRTFKLATTQLLNRYRDIIGQRAYQERD